MVLKPLKAAGFRAQSIETWALKIAAERVLGYWTRAMHNHVFRNRSRPRCPGRRGSMRNLLKYAGWTGLLLGIALSTGCASIRPPAGARAIEKTLLVTAYCPCGKCCGWKRTWYGRPVYSSGPARGKPKKVGVTADGSKAKKGTIAADLSIYPFKTVMYVPGYGYGRVEDCGGGIKGNHIEVFFSSHKQALKWGKQTRKAKVWLP